jgi:hypothetical protein
MTHTEINENYSAIGVGGAASLALRWRRLGLEVTGLQAAFEPDSVDLGSYDMLQWDVRFSFWVAPIAALEISRFNREVDPEFAAPAGGGESGLALEIGLGVAVGTANGRFRVKAESNFQRIDREVNGQDVPVQVTQARLGLELGF